MLTLYIENGPSTEIATWTIFIQRGRMSWHASGWVFRGPGRRGSRHSQALISNCDLCNIETSVPNEHRHIRSERVSSLGNARGISRRPSCTRYQTVVFACGENRATRFKKKREG